jgi:hypothetical protein
MHLTTFTRLKQLKLLGVRCYREILLDLTSAFLEAAPSLVELEMDVSYLISQAHFYLVVELHMPFCSLELCTRGTYLFIAFDTFLN